MKPIVVKKIDAIKRALKSYRKMEVEWFEGFENRRTGVWKTNLVAEKS